MPLYEYECEACGNRFEQIQKFSDSPLEECPKCGKKSLQKLVSSPAIKFKGSGWYINDYAKKDSAGAAKASKESKDEKTSSSDSAKSTTASDSAASTPAATTPSKDS